MSKREWQAVEYEVLSKIARAGKTDAEIAVILDRTEKDVKTTRQKLGIASLNAVATQTWTAEEERKLVDLFDAGWTYASIAEALGRTVSSVSGKCRVAGLVKDEPPKPSERIVFSTVSQALRYPPMRVGERDPFELDAQLRAFALAMREGGHKHGAGERKIESDRRVPVRFATPLTHSPIGSSAAACIG